MHRSSSSVAAVNSIERDRKKFWRKLRPSLFSNLFSSLFVFPSSFSLFLVSFVFLYARSVIRISLRFLDRFILHLSFHLFPFFSIFFLHVPFFPALAHYRKLEVTRERGILMYTVELRCSRKKEEREGEREGGKVNYKVLLIGGAFSVAFCREERHVSSRDNVVWRLTHFYFLYPCLHHHFLATLCTNLLFFSYSRENQHRSFLPLLLAKKNIKIKLGAGGEEIGNF